jgi:hypothetical protein
MLRYALNAAISMDSGAPQTHELLLANCKTEHDSELQLLASKLNF